MRRDMHPHRYRLLRSPSGAPAREDIVGDAFVDPDPKLRPDEASRVTRLAVQTLARLRCEGRGPRFIRLGSRILYRLSDLEDWLTSRTATSTTEADELEGGTPSRASEQARLGEDGVRRAWPLPNPLPLDGRANRESWADGRVPRTGPLHD